MHTNFRVCLAMYGIIGNGKLIFRLVFTDDFIGSLKVTHSNMQVIADVLMSYSLVYYKKWWRLMGHGKNNEAKVWQINKDWPLMHNLSKQQLITEKNKCPWSNIFCFAFFFFCFLKVFLTWPLCYKMNIKCSISGLNFIFFLTLLALRSAEWAWENLSDVCYRSLMSHNL